MIIVVEISARSDQSHSEMLEYLSWWWNSHGTKSLKCRYNTSYHLMYVSEKERRKRERTRRTLGHENGKFSNTVKWWQKKTESGKLAVIKETSGIWRLGLTSWLMIMNM